MTPQTIVCGCGQRCAGHKGAAQHARLTGCTRLQEGNYAELMQTNEPVPTPAQHQQPPAGTPTAHDHQTPQNLDSQEHRQPSQLEPGSPMAHEQQEPEPDARRCVPDQLGSRWSILSRSREAPASAPVIADHNKVTDYDAVIESEEVRDITAVLLELKKNYRIKLLKHYPAGRLPYSNLQEFLQFVQPDQVRGSFNCFEWLLCKVADAGKRDGSSATCSATSALSE